MSSGRYSAVLHQIERLFGAGTVAGLTEWQLLRRYVTLRDEVAFAALVARHGPTVLGVCRRLLDDPHDVEDAFQATFLVLVRRAGSLREHDALGSWLYGVACRVASRARSDSARRLRRERTGVAVEAVASPGGDPSRFELGPLLDEELGRLPPKYRAPIVLCYLEGQTHEEAARRLGWPIGSVKGRLARAREVLKGRLARRGLTCSVGALTTALARDATAAVPEVLQASTVRAALALAAGQASAAGLVSASAALLMEGALKAMFLTKLKTAVMGLTLCGLVATGAGVLAFQDSADPRNHPPREKGAVAQPAPEKGRPAAAQPKSETRSPIKEAKLNASPPPLVEAAKNAFETSLKMYRGGEASQDPVVRWSQLWLESQLMASDKPPDRAAAFEAHFDRMKQIEARAKELRDKGQATLLDLNTAQFYRLQAEQWLSREKAGLPPTGGGDQPGGKDPKSQALLKKLDAPVAMNFPEETSLQDVLNYIKSGIQDFDAAGIQIYVDPIGLQEAEKTMTSPVTIDLEGIPLRRTLYLLLRQLGLVYTVQDGLLLISTPERMEELVLESPIVEYSEAARLSAKAARGELTEEEKERLITIRAQQLMAQRARPSGKTGGMGGGMGGGGFMGRVGGGMGGGIGTKSTTGSPPAKP